MPRSRRQQHAGPACRQSHALLGYVSRIVVSTLAVLSVGGCGLFSPLGDGGETTTDGGAYGFGKPTLQVTINGVRFGPAAPDPGSGASLENAHGSGDRIQQSRFRVAAQSTAGQAICSIDLQRIGDGVSPIGVGSYVVTAASASVTPDGMVEPVSGEGVTVPQGTWQCTGAGCQGAGFVITALDANHVEGYLSGTFANYASSTTAQVACSFYLPMLVYTP